MKKFYEMRLNQIMQDLKLLKKASDDNSKLRTCDFFKNDIKVLKQTISEFIVDYELQNTELFYTLQYQFGQI